MLSGYMQTNLASDLPGLAVVTDPNLRNPWGISMSPIGPFWFGDNSAGVSDVVDGGGNIVPLVVTTPGPGGTAGKPTGTVFNGGPGFVISENGISAPALFLFVGEDGTISGWNPSVDMNHSILMVGSGENPNNPSAVFKGLALASQGNQTFLYVTDFRTGTVDVFDQDFHPVHVHGMFSDPGLPAGYAPFGIQAIDDEIFVTYAKQNANRYDDVPGSGHGFVDEFTTGGQLIRRLASGGVLNSPWGVALAPADFGEFSNDVLVGNAGDGRIHAFDPATGALKGELTDPQGNALQDGRLWALTFGNGKEGGATDVLYFASGLDNEEHGLFGMIQPADRADAGHIPGAGQGANGSNPYDPNSGDDDYPLPPTKGPNLIHDAGQQPALVPVLLPVRRTSVVMVPTLLSVSSADATNTAVSATAGSSTATTAASTFAPTLAPSSLGTVSDAADGGEIAANPPTLPAAALTSLLTLDFGGGNQTVAAEATATPVAAASTRDADLLAPPDSPERVEVAPVQPAAADIEASSGHEVIVRASPPRLETAAVGQTLVELVEAKTGSAWKPIVSAMMSLTAVAWLWCRRHVYRPLAIPISVESRGGQATLPCDV
ncbi:MAG TPA: TIGR03118 family protein [Gemmataceae bacterium]|nr:TIGR03118 family protein [Gemmataceae bacterium]